MTNKEERELSRPEWIKWYYLKFYDAVALFDEEQCGWFLKLTLYAATKGVPAGYLPKNESRLRKIAEYKELSTDVEQILKQVTVPNELLFLLKLRREEKWTEVRDQFTDSPQFKNLIYNKIILDAVQDAYRKKKLASKAGKISRSISREITLQHLKTDKILPVQRTLNGRSTPVEQTLDNPLLSTNNTDKNFVDQNFNGRLTGVEQTLTNPLQTDIYENKNFVRQETKKEKEHIYDVTNLFEIDNSNTEGVNEDKLEIDEIELVNNKQEDSENFERDRETEKKEKKEKKERREKKPITERELNKTLFDENLFYVTAKTRERIEKKYPELDEGDIEHLTEKFKDVYYGKRYTSWSRTFFNFINNQMVKYNYEPGSHNWRQRRKETEEKNHGRERSKKFETAADRHKRIRRETAARIQELSRGDDEGGLEDSESLPLDPSSD